MGFKWILRLELLMMLLELGVPGKGVLAEEKARELCAKHIGHLCNRPWCLGLK